MNILKSVQRWLETCPDIELVHLDMTDEKPSSFAVALSGNTLLSTQLNGDRTYQYSFQFYVRDYAQTDAERGANYDLLQAISDWVEEQDEQENYPALPARCVAERMSVANMLLMQVDGDGDAAVYQIQLQLIYTKEKERVT